MGSGGHVLRRGFALFALLVLSFGLPVSVAASIVATNVPDNATAVGNARRLVRDSEGYLYAAYSAGVLDSGVHVARSADDGETWQSVWAELDPMGGSPALAIDSHDNLHCVWVSSDAKIYYKKYDHVARSWDSSPTDLTAGLGGGWANRLPAIAVDSGDNVHVVWEHYVPPCITHHIYYAKLLPNSGWILPAVDIDDDSMEFFVPSIAVDSNNHLYVVYEGGWSGVGNTICLCTYTTSWVQTTVSNTGSQPCVAVDAYDHLHLVYVDSDRVNYRRFSGGLWSTPTILDDELHVCHWPSIAISTEAVYVMWHNNVLEHNIWQHHSLDLGSTWPAGNRLLLANGLYPSLRWSYYDNPNVFGDMKIMVEWIYTAPVSSYDVKYDKLAEEAITVGGRIEPANPTSLLAPFLITSLIVIAVSIMAIGRRKQPH